MLPVAEVSFHYGSKTTLHRYLIWGEHPQQGPGGVQSRALVLLDPQAGSDGPGGPTALCPAKPLLSEVGLCPNMAPSSSCKRPQHIALFCGSHHPVFSSPKPSAASTSHLTDDGHKPNSRPRRMFWHSHFSASKSLAPPRHRTAPFSYSVGTDTQKL